MSERKLVKKLTEVMQEVKYIQKKGFNSFNNYKYATESDVAEKIREELANRCIMMIPNILESSYREHTNRKGNTEYITRVRMEFKFIDGETGEELIFHSEGEGQDAGDKGIYKAITGAQKYALMKAFMIPTGDDPEADSGGDERNAKSNQTNEPAPTEDLANSKQVGLIKVLVKSIGMVKKVPELEVLQKALKEEKEVTYDILTTLTKTQASELIKLLQKWQEQSKEVAAH